MEDSSGKFVDDLNQAVLDHIIHIFVEKPLCLHGLGEIMHELEVAFFEKASLDQPAFLEQFFDMVESLTGEHDPLGFLVHPVIAPKRFGVVFLRIFPGFGVLFQFAQGEGKAVYFVDLIGIVFRRTGDDQGGSRLVDQDGVYFVHDTVIMSPLHPRFRRPGHIVP